MGGVDVVTLHLQYWFYAVGFVAAVAGMLLGARARRGSSGRSSCSRSSRHGCRESLLVPQADFLLQFFVCALRVVAGRPLAS